MGRNLLFMTTQTSKLYLFNYLGWFKAWLKEENDSISASLYYCTSVPGWISPAEGVCVV